MMTQSFPPGMAPGHPAMGGHGHPMAGMQHPGAAHIGGPPGPNMMQGMHPGVSGPQVTQGPMVTGMPQGPGTPAPGPMHNGSMAMAHLGPQQHMFQQQNPQMAGFGQMPMNSQQQAMIRQQMMQRMQAQQQGGMPMGMQNNPGFNQAQQLAQMKMAGMPMHQQQQMQANQQQNMQQLAHQQRIMQAHHQQQQAASHQAALAVQHQQRQQQASQQMQLTRSQEQQTSQPPQPHSTPAPQNQPPPPTQSTPSTQPQQPPKSQAQAQPATSQAANPPAQVKQNENEDEVEIKQQDLNEAGMIQEMPKDNMLVGLPILQLIMFQDSLANPESPNDLSRWEDMIRKFFAPSGFLSQQFVNVKTGADKSFRIQYPSLARFYHTHYGSGIRQILLQSYSHSQNRVGNGGVAVNSESVSLTYVFHNDVRVTTKGSLLVLLDESNKIHRFDLWTHGWQEYIPKNLLTPSSPDQKPSPKMNKNIKKVQQQGKVSSSGSSGLNIPSSGINEWGVPNRLIAFLEVVEVIVQMQPLMDYFQSHPELTPQQALLQFNQEQEQNNAAMNHIRLQNQVARQQNGQVQFPNNMPQAMNGPNFASPGMAHLGLPQAQGSPHIGGPVHTPSPAQNQGAGGVAMMHQMSAPGSNLSGSQGASTNTSPNVSNKRRRPSAIKLEEENPSQEGGAGKVKPSPRIGGKRQKAG